MVGGYAGKLLQVDLTDGRVEKEDLDLELAKKYIGGRGLAARLLWDRTAGGTDPLSPQNLLMFLLGPITGVFGGGHTCVAFKSPETQTIGHAIVGGHWGAELKYAGYDGLIVQGRSNSPVYVCIRDDDVSIRDARHLWGKGTTQTEMKIREETEDPFVKVLSCGPAGENLVRMAGIVHSTGHAGARGGGGAVMGSKNLKAVVVRGTKGVRIERTRECLDLTDNFRKRLLDLSVENLSYFYRRFGSSFHNQERSDMGELPVKNYQFGKWDKVDQIGATTLERRNLAIHTSCHHCPRGDLNIYVVRSGEYAGTVCSVDFDSSALIGPSCLVEDVNGLMYINALCDELGLDTEGFGGIIAWVMECYEKGLLTEEELDGVDLRWGNVSAMVELIKRTVLRNGFGDTIAEGYKYAIDKVGKGAKEFAMQCKGMGFGGFQPKLPGRGLQYAVGDRGGCHHYGISIDEQNIRAMADSVTFCAWHRSPIGRDYGRLLDAVTGWDLITKTEDWDRIAERILILSRAYNIREGMKPLDDDVLPARAFREPCSVSPEKFRAARAEWYNIRGCTTEGIPTKEHLEELELGFVIPILEAKGCYD